MPPSSSPEQLPLTFPSPFAGSDQKGDSPFKEKTARQGSDPDHGGKTLTGESGS